MEEAADDGGTGRGINRGCEDDGICGITGGGGIKPWGGNPGGGIAGGKLGGGIDGTRKKTYLG